MARLALVGGGSLRGIDLPDGDFELLARHGTDPYVLPHRIDHAANMRGLTAAGCDRVLAVGSVGGLRPEPGPGALVCPDDFIALDAEPLTTLAGPAAHRVPGFDPGWRAEVLTAFAAVGTDARDGGVYWQARGPRLETPAEIRFAAGHADVIGMTIASECVVAGELGLRYAAVCVIDNLANGVGEGELTLAEVEANRAANRGPARGGARGRAGRACLNPSMPLTVSGALLDGEPVGLRASDGLIEALGPAVEPLPGDEILDATGLAIVPGLINAHTHAAMTLFRGYADDLPLMDWLENHIWPAEQRLEREDVYWGARLACMEMARSGTIRFWDMYWKQAETARAVKDAGLRAVVGAPLIDGKDPDGAPRLLEKARRTIDEIEEAGEGAVRAALAPHAVYTVSEPSLRGIAEISAEREVPVEIHLSETEGEVSACLGDTGLRPAHYLDRCGLLGPRTLLAHCVWLDRDEIDLIAERGATMVTNPVANLKLAVGGVFPYLEARDAGAQVGLGTDGAGSNNSLDLLSDVKTFALMQKHVAADPAAITAGEAWEIATGQRSELLGGRPPGVGAPADFALVRLDSPGLALGALDAGLVYAADASAVASTVVGGRVVYRQGDRTEADEIVAKARERAKALLG